MGGGIVTGMDTDTTPATTTGPLTDTELAMLQLERSWWQYAGAKETRVRELFGITSTIYYQRLNALIDRPEALAADPVVVRRLQRLRAARQDARKARRPM